MKLNRIRGKKEKANQKGAILLMLALMIIPLIGLGALAMDIALLHLKAKEVRNVATLAALAGIKRFTMKNPTLAAIQTTAQQTALQNSIRLNETQNDAVIVNAVDVQLGKYNLNTEIFTPVSDVRDPAANAVRVQIRMGEGSNAPFSFQLARALGMTGRYAWEEEGLAAFGRKHIVVALDMSGSMDDAINSYPPYVPDPLVYCPTTTMVDPGQRNFLLSPKSNFDAVECLGGKPQPIYSIFEITRDTLLANKLFDYYYRAGLVAYGTKAFTYVDLDVDNNKNAVKDAITNQALNYWDNYRINQDPSAFVPGQGQIFPGGDDPLNTLGTGRTGFTNIGKAIELSRYMINRVTAEAGAQSLNMIVLLSDGVPNCSEAGICGNYDENKLAGFNYAIKQAKAAKDDRIVIHAVYFDQAQETSKCVQTPGYQVLYEVAYRANGKSYCARDLSHLTTIFNQLSELPPFVIVENP